MDIQSAMQAAFDAAMKQAREAELNEHHELTLGELRDTIAAKPEGHVFDAALSHPFSWRGIYAEVAFTLEDRKATREALLCHVGSALAETFEGYKGGDYCYSRSTPVHFEAEPRDCTNGDYERANAHLMERLGLPVRQKQEPPHAH